MERSLLETIQSLGLDIQLAIVLLMFALDGIATLGRRIVARRAPPPRRIRLRTVATRPMAANVVEAWPPESLSASRAQAA